MYQKFIDKLYIVETYIFMFLLGLIYPLVWVMCKIIKAFDKDHRVRTALCDELLDAKKGFDQTILWYDIDDIMEIKFADFSTRYLSGMMKALL